MLKFIVLLVSFVSGHFVSGQLDIEPELRKIDRKCYEELGCFDLNGAFFHPLLRPVNSPPQDLDKINTKFNLFTRLNPQERDALKYNDLNSIINSQFNPNIQTKIITHGFMDNELFGLWMQQMKDQLLVNGNYNVIIVDWAGGNKPPYVQATANTRVVGAQIALMIKKLQEVTGTRPESFHIIGHSLGAHIAGYAGERIAKLGRITGLDPAEPNFQGLPERVRLDPSDAEFVDAIHTDGKSIFLLGYGMNDPVGHIDFYPNSGMNQPGSAMSGLTSFFTDGLPEGFRRAFAGNHQRSIDYFIDSINRVQCSMVSYACIDWAHFDDGQCADCSLGQCPIMGLRASESAPFVKKLFNERNQNSLKLYLKTDKAKPFCLTYYDVLLKIPKLTLALAVQMTFTLQGTNGNQKVDMSEKEVLSPETTFLVPTSKDLGKITQISVNFKTKNKLTSSIKIESITIKPMHIANQSDRMNRSSKLCYKQNSPFDVIVNKEATFTTDC